MPDSKVEVKACPWCQQQPIKRTDSYIPDAVACPNGHTAPMRLSEWNNRPIANNGVSITVAQIEEVIWNKFKYGPEVQDEALYHRAALKIYDIIHAKLQPTAPRGGGEIKHADNCPSVKGAPVCTCEHLRRYS